MPAPWSSTADIPSLLLQSEVSTKYLRKGKFCINSLEFQVGFDIIYNETFSCWLCWCCWWQPGLCAEQCWQGCYCLILTSCCYPSLRRSVTTSSWTLLTSLKYSTIMLMFLDWRRVEHWPETRPMQTSELTDWDHG